MQPGTGEEAEGKILLAAGAAEAGHGDVQFAAGSFQVRRVAPRAPFCIRTRWVIRGGQRRARPTLQNRCVERGAPQGEVVEGDVEQRGPDAALVILERLRRAPGDGAAGI